MFQFLAGELAKILEGVAVILTLDGKLPEVFWFGLVIGALKKYAGE